MQNVELKRLSFGDCSYSACPNLCFDCYKQLGVGQYYSVKQKFAGVGCKGAGCRERGRNLKTLLPAPFSLLPCLLWENLKILNRAVLRGGVDIKSASLDLFEISLQARAIEWGLSMNAWVVKRKTEEEK